MLVFINTTGAINKPFKFECLNRKVGLVVYSQKIGKAFGVIAWWVIKRAMDCRSDNAAIIFYSDIDTDTSKKVLRWCILNKELLRYSICPSDIGKTRVIPNTKNLNIEKQVVFKLLLDMYRLDGKLSEMRTVGWAVKQKNICNVLQ